MYVNYKIRLTQKNSWKATDISNSNTFNYILFIYLFIMLLEFTDII